MNKKRILAAMMSVILLASLSGCAKVDEPDTDPKTSHSSTSNKSDNDSKSENKSDDKSETESKDNTSKDNESRDNESKPASSGSTNNGSDIEGTSSNTTSSTNGSSGNNVGDIDDSNNTPSIDVTKRNKAYNELELDLFNNHFYIVNENGERDETTEFPYLTSDALITYNDIKTISPNMDKIWYDMAYVMIRSYTMNYNTPNHPEELSCVPAALSCNIKQIDATAINKIFNIDTSKLIDYSVWTEHKGRTSDSNFQYSPADPINSYNADTSYRIGILEAKSEEDATEIKTHIENYFEKVQTFLAENCPTYPKPTQFVKQKETTIYFATYGNYFNNYAKDPTPFFEEVV